MDCDRYEKMIVMAKKANIYAMLLERKTDPVWLTTKEVFADLSLFTGELSSDEPSGRTTEP